MFNVNPDTHIESLESSEKHVVEGTSKWSCKIKVSGRILSLSNLFQMSKKEIHLVYFHIRQRYVILYLSFCAFYILSLSPCFFSVVFFLSLG